MKFFVVSLGGLLFLYFAVLITLYFFQEKMLFPGTKLPENFQFRAIENLSERSIEVEGARLSALHFQNDSPRGLIFFLHGNAGNLDSWVPDVEFYKQERYDLFMIDYRGYGKSSGKIQSQRQLEADVEKAWQLVAPQYEERNLPIVIYGRSLGTYLATNLARSKQADLLVLVSPYTSIRAMAKRAFPWAPSWLLRYPMANDEIIHEISPPLLILHGINDRLIPAQHAETLHRLSREKGKMTRLSSNLTLVDGAGHNDIHEFSEYTSTLSNALP